MPRVLIVDDEQQIRHLLRTTLVHAGHEVHTADNALAAIALCVPPPSFDVVISDVVMPGMDGHELARWFAVHFPNCRVILMSAFDAGCDECPYFDNCQRISKPFRPQEFATLVSDALARPPRPRRLGEPAGNQLNRDGLVGFEAS